LLHRYMAWERSLGRESPFFSTNPVTLYITFPA
jgi:hypothetical protein